VVDIFAFSCYNRYCWDTNIRGDSVSLCPLCG